MRISEICEGKRPVTADTALLLARAFGTTAGFLGLQADYDTEKAEKVVGDSLKRIISPGNPMPSGA